MAQINKISICVAGTKFDSLSIYTHHKACMCSAIHMAASQCIKA